MNSKDHFCQCINENCRMFHPIDIGTLSVTSSESNSIDWLLCDRCKVRKEIEHVIQCLGCKTVLDFLPAINGETPGIFYVEKCSHCGGTIEDEIRIVANVLKELYA